MTDGQSEWMRAEDERRLVFDERDQIELPEMPDLRCREHGNVCEVVHSIHNRLVLLEARVRKLEERK